MSREKVKRYYDSFDEWGRLETPAGVLEFERTLSLLHSHLRPRSRILDLGGGPGRYAIALAKAGHRVCLADLSEQLLGVARRKIIEHGVQAQIESITCANATDLRAFADLSFDAVLALGPFYHLARCEDREAAAREATRVLKPKGLLVVAFLPRLTGIAGLIGRAAAHPDQVSPDGLGEAYQTGVFHNHSDQGFQEGYYADPGEIQKLFAGTGVQELSLCSCRGIAYGQEEPLLRIRQSRPELYDQFMAIIAATSQDRAAIDLGGHALYLGRKIDSQRGQSST
jgi:ubiquinone/menaquinone biosynthesis C-methylase UbiE